MVRKSIFVMQFVLDDANPLTMIQLLLDLDPYSSLLTVIGIRDCSYPNVGISKNSLLIKGRADLPPDHPQRANRQTIDQPSQAQTTTESKHSDAKSTGTTSVVHHDQ